MSRFRNALMTVALLAAAGLGAAQGSKSPGAAGVVAVAVLAVEFVQQIRCAVDDEVLLNEIRRGVDATEQLDDAEPVERAVGLADRAQNLDGAVFRGGVALLDSDVLAQHAFLIARVARGDQQISRADAEIEVTRFDGGKFQSQFGGFFFGAHDVSFVYEIY